MKRSLSSLLVAPLLCLGTVAAFGGAAAAYGSPTDDKAAIAERFHAAGEATALDAEGVKPWHLKLDVQLYDAKGNPAEQGTIEEWWGGPKLRLTMFTLPSYTGKVIENADGTFLSAGLGSIPASLEGLLNQIVHPMPALQDVDQSQPQVQKQSFGKVQLECVMLARPMGATTAIPMGLFPTYCFDPGTTTLRASYNLGSEAILRNGVGRFQQRLVATSISINNGPVKLATAKISTLAGMMPDASMFVKTDDMVSEKMALISGAVMAGTIIKKVPPQYPEGARQRHVSGTVVLRAYIGRDGHIYSLRLMSAGDPELAVAAIAAVRDWTYKPYLLNGEPTEVDTTITVNFSFGPG